ncbi:iron chelate uptake ABC transporter family permease subunit [Zhihengliuella halotolerans]|uniref:iron chelate uptake ABC transporter family permease subunit n=1 Tax=Zhihengliuella halotolerans TaxID=370736 RepID=UPI000C80185C|nr:iron chelate uptake ABC transporter family permease subunit [Zhihengliuella halotolerans]
MSTLSPSPAASTTTARPAPSTAPPAARARRRLTPGARIAIIAALVAVASACFLLMFIRGSFEFAFERRLTMWGTMIVVAFTQGVGTVVFHTVTHNRILTPSIMGFDSIYTLMQTVLVSVFGGLFLVNADGVPMLLGQTAAMVLFATVLYRWLFSGKFGSLYILLLVGVVFGMAFDSISIFLQRLLNPTDYDMLSVELMGRMSAVDATYLPWAFAVCAAVGWVLWSRRFRLDVLLLGRDAAQGLGINHKRELTAMLIVIAVMVAFSTALAGPMTFFGFIVATLAYQAAGTHEHRYVMPMAFLLGLFTLVAGQFVLQHVFYASGFLTVIIEFVGGALFLLILLRKGKM